MALWPVSFTEDAVSRIYGAAIEILETTGVVFHDEGAVDLFKRHGFSVDGKKVFAKPSDVERALKTAPASFTLFAADPDKNVTIGGNRMVLAPGYGAPFLMTQEGERRPALVKDYKVFTKLVQTSDVLDMNGYLMVEPADGDIATRFLDLMHINMTLCDKPFLASSKDRQAALDTIALAAIRFGGLEAMAARPPMMPLISVLSPLSYAQEMTTALMAYAEAGMPVICASGTMAGSSGPVTVAGVLALITAENLFGLMLSQLVNPGVGFVFGGAAAPMDMVTGSMSTGSPGVWQLIAGTVAMARHLDLPVRSGGALTDAVYPDIQAGIEASLNLAATFSHAPDFVLHAAGILGSFMTMSFEKFLVDEEIIRMIQKGMEPVKTDEDALDVEMIQRVGPGGHFLMEEKTLLKCRSEFFHSTLLTRDDYHKWGQSGKKTPVNRAADHLEKRLDAWQRPDVDPAVVKDMDLFLQSRKP